MFVTRTALALVTFAACTGLALAGAAHAGPNTPTADDDCAGLGVHVGLCGVLAEHHVLSGNSQQIGSCPEPSARGPHGG